MADKLTEEESVALKFMLLPFLAIWNAWIFKTLWFWFVEGPLNVRGLSMPIAYGMMLFFAWIVHKPPNKEEREENWVERLGNDVSRDLVVFAFCWGAHKLAVHW